MGLLDLIRGSVNEKPHAERKAECPKCKEPVSLGMERCPKCGTRLESMFRIECPKCKTANPLNSPRCSKCGYDISDRKTPAPPEGVQYRCPICSYTANYYMLSCPSCGTRFV
ncbi:Double zinc ribbon [uncultured archaeon]|nr:Double zinc ribbon [uncultured archaeon]